MERAKTKLEKQEYSSFLTFFPIEIFFVFLFRFLNIVFLDKIQSHTYFTRKN